MNLHEFQAKQILEAYGISVPEFYVVTSVSELECLLQKKGWKSAVLKAQIHAGGRGKGGGVKIGHSPHELFQAAQDLLGKRIVTPQTGPQGLAVSSILVSPLVDIVKESYLGLTIDRQRGQIVLIASPVGGMDIEKVAQEMPDKVLFLPLPMEGIFRSYHYLYLANFMGWKEMQTESGTLIVKALVKALKENDAILLEINPLVESSDGQLINA